MQLKTLERLELPPSADMHVHLRQGELMELVAPQVRKGGVDTVFVMPNLQPPVTTVAQALEYKARLESIAPGVTYLMSLPDKLTVLVPYSSITPEVIAEAAAKGVAGVKVYPQGVTTNSESGVVSLTDFYPVIAAIQTHDLVLNLHGEVAVAPADASLSLEEAFLPVLAKLHADFPTLRIVLEHCTTAAAVEAVKACGPTVGATITAHHLYLTVEDTCDPFAFCKPIPKKPEDRDALIKAACSGDPKFFFGSDSAPHPLQSKTSAVAGKVPAGVFTQPYATQLVLLAIEDAVQRGTITDDDVTQEKLEGFLSGFGRRFYRLPPPLLGLKIVLERKGEVIPESIQSEDGKVEVGVSRGGDAVWSLRWAEA